MGIRSEVENSRQNKSFPKHKEVGVVSGCAVSAEGKAQPSMGIALGDYDRDDDFDLHVTNFYAEPNVLYANSATHGFEDASLSSRIWASTNASMGWGTVFADFNLDGWEDLFVTNGHLEDYRFMESPEPYLMTPQNFENSRNNQLTDVSELSGSYFKNPSLGRGLACGDLDHDGDPDLVISRKQDPASVLTCQQVETNHWLIVQPVGTTSNRSGLGVKIRLIEKLKPMVRTIFSGGGFQSASDQAAHFGLGENSEAIELEVN